MCLIPLRPVYPRVGGATVPAATISSTIAGLSPRGRGNPHRPQLTRLWYRSIPAWAGQPLQPADPPSSTQVYPRVGGATVAEDKVRYHATGLSPRGRGNHCRPSMGTGMIRSIPAWAGQPRSRFLNNRIFKVYPRVGGATSQASLCTPDLTGLSPRGRGNRPETRVPVPVARSIPAWAGQPSQSRSRTKSTAVYPRVGGATQHACRQPFPPVGLSPRGRGNPGHGQTGLVPPGSIPAWAGQPY